MRFVERFARVVTLDELRADAASASMMALRPGNRLSVTPVSAAEFRAACRLAKRAAAR
jgi:predicted RNA-binding protein with PUA-like domain